MKYCPKNIQMTALYLMLSLTLVFLLSATDGTKYKLWDVNNKLNWSDFKDTAMVNSDRAAATDAGIKVDFVQTTPGTLTITVFSAMYPAYSWVDSTRKTAYILSHEQYHFNIAEYWSRKLKKDFASSKFTVKNVREKVSILQKQNFKNCHDMQVQYDAETKHSEIEPEQKKWTKKIDELLKSVEDYSGSSIEVKLK
jgi:hypothetical protein